MDNVTLFTEIVSFTNNITSVVKYKQLIIENSGN